MTITISGTTYYSIKTSTEHTKIGRTDKNFEDYIELIFRDVSKLIIKEPYKINTGYTQGG